jgi:glycosyltransferase involved in cell wall biosynthesis
MLFVTGTSPDVRGGSGTYVGISVLKEAIEARGHAVEFLAPRTRGFVSLARRLAFNYSVRDAARLHRPDVVVGFDWDGLFLRGAGQLHAAAIKGVIAEEARFERGIPRWRLTFEARLEKAHVGRSDRVVTTSRYAATRISAVYSVDPDCIAVVAEPIDLARWSRALSSAPRVDSELPSILCVAHLYPRKDVAGLLTAMARMKSPAFLRVVGVGPEMTRLERRTRELGLSRRVAFLGHVSFGELAAEYKNAKIFCLPSRQEGFGIVFLEAMASGLPIVAARAAAVPEVVIDGECGRLVPPGDSEALADVLDQLISDAAERNRLGSGGRRRVESFDAPLVAQEFLRALGIAP